MNNNKEEKMKHISIAAIVQDLAISQKTFYLIKEFNKCINDTSLSTGVFNVRSCIPSIPTLFGCKMTANLCSYNGVIISTTLEEAEVTLRTSNNTSKYLYLWDLDWIDNPVSYSIAMNILRDERLKIVARSNDHAALIKNFCNKEVVGIVDNWNMDQFLPIIKHYNKEKQCQAF
jgi:hypothetical protein